MTGRVTDIDAPLVNSMLSGFSRNRLYSQAWHLYHEMQRSLCDADATTYAAMINVCAMEGKSEKALNLLDEMERKGFTATKLALNTVVKACARVHPTHYSQIKGDLWTANNVVSVHPYSKVLVVCSVLIVLVVLVVLITCSTCITCILIVSKF